MKLPIGSTWLVLPYTNSAFGLNTPSGIDARTSPTGNTYNPWDVRLKDRPSPYIDIPANTIIITGQTVKDTDQLVYRHAEWVEVIFPIKCYINRTHFNADSTRLIKIG